MPPAGEHVVEPVGYGSDSCASLGRSADGRQWLVYTNATFSVTLRLWGNFSDEPIEVPISGPDEFAFFPAGALDGRGRLHVVWYDSSGATGVLRYVRSRSDNLEEGFPSPAIVDSDACPGNGWHPQFDDRGGRRLREYIDIALDDNRVHLSWTHAPRAPARVYTAYIELE